MAVWLVRAGSDGEYEQKFLQDGRIYLTWDHLNAKLDALPSRQSLIELLGGIVRDAKPKKLINHASQIWPFATLDPAGPAQGAVRALRQAQRRYQSGVAIEAHLDRSAG